MANKVFSERIRNLRQANNMTIYELAAKVNVTKSSISMWENNGTVPRPEILIELSKLYDVSIDHLLGNDWKDTILAKMVVEWWNEHQYDTEMCGEEEYNLYEHIPEFVKMAKKMLLE